MTPHQQRERGKAWLLPNHFWPVRWINLICIYMFTISVLVQYIIVPGIRITYLTYKDVLVL